MDGSRMAFVIRSLPKTPLITAWMTETTKRSTMIALVRAHRLAVSMEVGGAGARHRADVAGSSLAGKEPDTGGQIRVLRQVQQFLRAKIQHAVIAGDQQ